MRVIKGQHEHPRTLTDAGYNLILRCYQVGSFTQFPLTIGVHIGRAQRLFTANRVATVQKTEAKP